MRGIPSLPGRHVTDHQMRLYMKFRQTDAPPVAAAKAAFSGATAYRFEADPRPPSLKARTRDRRRAETLPIDQLELGLEDVQQVEADRAAEVEALDPERRAARARARRANRGSLPAHLPRIEQIVDVEDKTCPCCKGALHRIGEEVSERLDIVAAQFRVLVTRRPKYACRACEEGVVQAPAPPRLIEGGIPTEALIAHVVVANTPIIAPSIAKPRSTPAKGSTWIARP